MDHIARQVLPGPAEILPGESVPNAVEIPPGIRYSQEAFWHALPKLLEKRNLGKWVAYHRDQRIGIARTKTELIREMVRRRIPRNEYFVGLIQCHDLPPWETEDVEPIHPRHFETVPPAP